MDNSAQSTTRSDANMIGNMSREQFDEMNDKGAEKVAAVTPINKSFSESDWQLLLQIAVGGTRQLELSRVAVDMATDEEVSVLAQSEVDEQNGLSDKLKDFADLKKLTLPSAPDEKTQEMVRRLKNLSGAEFDRAYVQTSGVIGHENLDAVMSKVKAEAEDADLLHLVTVVHPLVQLHLQVSQAILEKFPAQN